MLTKLFLSFQYLGMSLVKQVKVGNITNLSEARYCAGMGVDYLSFPASIIDPKTFKEITGWISGPKFGIEVNGDADIESYNPDFVEVSVQHAKRIKGKPMVVSIDANDLPAHHEKLVLLKSNILFLDVYCSDPSTLQSTIQEYTEDFQIFARFHSGEIETYLNQPIDGISLEGNAEERPGLKEYPLAEVLEKMEAGE